MSNRIVRRGATLAVIVAFVIAALGSPAKPVSGKAPVPPSNQALYVLDREADTDAVVRAIQQAGGQVTHLFPGQAVIARGTRASPPPDGVSAVYSEPLEKKRIRGAPARVAKLWNTLLAPDAQVDDSGALTSGGSELVGDAMVAPAPAQVQLLGATSSPTPGFSETSEYFIGRVAVGLVLPESNGSVDDSTEDWTEDERELVLSEIVSALDWWAALEPRANLTFVYDDGTAEPTDTDYEPISRPYTDQSLWISDVMERKGHVGASYFDQVRQYNNALRDTYDTDWAFTIFVVDSSTDKDNRFSDGYFAYSYVGGPFTVLTLGNNGYGTANMDAVAAHEIGHIFGALDQYQYAHQPCSSRSGYLYVENQNSEYGDCALDDASIMRGGTRAYRRNALDIYARGQLGWRDSDGDDILDPADTTLTVGQIDVVTDVHQSNIFTVSGRLRDEPYPSPAGRDLVINEIRQVQYRVPGLEWSDAQPTDGVFDSAQEDFSFTTPRLPEGTWDVTLRAWDSAGNAITQTVATLSSEGFANSSPLTPTATAPDISLLPDYTEDDVRAEVETAGGGCDVGEQTITDNHDGTYTVVCDYWGVTDSDTGALLVQAGVDTSLIPLWSDVGDADPSPATYGGQGLSPSSVIADIRYRLDEGPWRSVEPDDGQFDESVEDFTLIFDPKDLSAGEHRVDVFATDADGNSDPSPATHSFTVGKTTIRVYLPLVSVLRP